MNNPRLLTSLAVAVAILACAPTSRAQYALSLTDNLGDPASVAVAPGQSFTFTLTLTSPGATSVALSYFLQVLEGGGNGQFRITARDLMGSTFSQPTTDNSIALQPADALLDPQNDSNLGADLADPNSPNGAGSFFVANFTLQALAGIAPGVYTLSTADAIVTDSGFSDNPVTDATYTVTVVPEPGTYMLLGIGALFCAQRFSRRTRRNVFRIGRSK